MQRCLLYTSDADEEEDSVDLGGRRIIKKEIFLTKSYMNSELILKQLGPETSF